MRKPMAWITKQAAMAAAYAVGYTLFRDLSFTHWLPVAGFRILCLILVPTRYWGALIVGETVPLILSGWELQGYFGRVWSVVNAIPTIALVMPFIAFFRQSFRKAQRKKDNVLDARRLLLCVLVVSAISTLNRLAAFHMMILPAGYRPPGLDVQVARFFLGDCVGLLSVLPVGLFLRDLLASGERNAWESKWWPLFRETLLFLSPVVVLLTVGGEMSSVLHSLQMLMFVPVVVLAWRHGWQGAALAGSAASVAVCLMMPERYDTGTMQSQVFIAMAMSTMLLHGAHMSAWRFEKKSKERRAAVLHDFSIFGSTQVDSFSIRETKSTTLGTGLGNLGNFATQDRSSRGSKFEELIRVLAETGIDARLNESSPPGAVCSQLQHDADQLAVDAVAYLLGNNQSAQSIVFDCRRCHSAQVEWLALRITASGTQMSRRSNADVRSFLLNRLHACIRPLWVLRHFAKSRQGYLRLRFDGGDMRISFLLKAQPSDRSEVDPIDLPYLSSGVVAQ